MIRRMLKNRIFVTNLCVILMLSLIMSGAMRVRAEEVVEVEVEGQEENKREVLRPDVCSFTVPAIKEGEGSLFDFIMDPQKLITLTGGASIDGASFEEGATLFFRHADGSYSSISDPVEIINNSCDDMKLTVRLVVTDHEGLELSSTRDFEDENAKSLYLAIVDKDGNELAPVSEEGSAEYSAVIPAGSVSDNGFAFAITGMLNESAMWSYTSEGVTFDTTWDMERIYGDEAGEDTSDTVSENDAEEEEPEVETVSDDEAEEESVSENEAADDEKDEPVEVETISDNEAGGETPEVTEPENGADTAEEAKEEPKEEPRPTVSENEVRSVKVKTTPAEEGEEAGGADEVIDIDAATGSVSGNEIEEE